ncbi:hydrogen peroxide-inducible genes activator, partial [Streptomyces sp. SID11233]|nr:hydrogen peroxide-inducible genes activator [Streptomyces sp. SID11233]
MSTEHVLAADGRARQPTLAQLRAFAAVAEHLH